jgi:hypothetical protein
MTLDGRLKRIEAVAAARRLDKPIPIPPALAALLAVDGPYGDLEGLSTSEAIQRIVGDPERLKRELALDDALDVDHVAADCGSIDQAGADYGFLQAGAAQRPE